MHLSFVRVSITTLQQWNLESKPIQAQALMLESDMFFLHSEYLDSLYFH